MGDIDHCTPYTFGRDGQPPPSGQTGEHNAGPLGRYAHRVKTHAQYTVRQPRPGTSLCRTPNGKHFLVDHNGTHAIDEQCARYLSRPSLLEKRLALEIDIPSCRERVCQYVAHSVFAVSVQ